jgi:Spy/CpxP family protein refolding chaperone
MDALREENRKAILAILNPEQKKKFNALRAQGGPGRNGWGRGPNMSGMLSRMKTELNLTASQEKQIAGILKTSDAKQGKLREKMRQSNGDRAQVRQEMQALRRNTMAQISKVLNAQQRAKLQQSFPNNGRMGGNGNRAPRRAAGGARTPA